MSDPLAFLHQKGGTGKTTLAIAAAQVLAARGASVLLLDADYQGTASAWGERYAAPVGAALGGHIAVRSVVDPDLAAAIARLGRGFERVLVDAPPTLSETTRRILAAAHRVIVPTRPAWPDVWALATVAGLLGEMVCPPRAEVVFSQVGDDDAGALRAEVEAIGLAVSPETIPRAPGFAALFRGEPLDATLRERTARALQL